ncbi:FIG01019523: hypothetical protein [hydrothermal vent metagenome]|uniref:DUF3817 domain-containing protein n=1 Tax=hydrothermal vent metagenome TaxID=652676 RepID=A0A3B0SW55_9ZZZZ
MLSTFRIVAILEGVSYLMLFGITMPLKYLADMPEPNKFVGYAHGFLFIAYVILAIIFWMGKKWSIKKGLIILVASLLPFGTFYIDKNYLKPLASKSQ